MRCRSKDIGMALDGYYIRQCNRVEGHHSRHRYARTSGPYPSMTVARDMLPRVPFFDDDPAGMDCAFSRGAAAAPLGLEGPMQVIKLEPNVDGLIKYLQAMYRTDPANAHAIVQAGWDFKSFTIREKLLRGEITLSEALSTK